MTRFFRRIDADDPLKELPIRKGAIKDTCNSHSLTGTQDAEKPDLPSCGLRDRSGSVCGFGRSSSIGAFVGNQGTCGVARWYIFKPKFPIQFGHIMDDLAMLNVGRSFWSFWSIFPFGYVVPRKIWQP
jgi:hypothetical protein